MPRLSLTIFSIFREGSPGRRQVLSFLLAMAATACLVPSADAVDPNRAFSQYIVDRWTSKNGFPGRQVSAFAQTPDGYLWVGTTNGLFRFDGFNFVSAQELDPTSSSLTGVLGLMTDGYGTLWVRTQGAILRFHNGGFEDVTSELKAGSFITAMSQSIDGGVLLSSLHGEILHGRESFSSIATSARFQTALVIATAQTSDSKVWLGTRGFALCVHWAC